MMTPQTVEQLLQVFRSFQDNHRSGMPLHRAYQEGVRAVADAHSITYQTIGDGCRRRLGLTDIGQLYDLLASWMKGDPSGLERQMKDNSDSSTHATIERFFSGGDVSTVENRKPLPKVPSSDDTEVFQFRLPAWDARMLKALAELEGVSVADLVRSSVTAAVRDRMAVVARGIIKDAGTRD